MSEPIYVNPLATPATLDQRFATRVLQYNGETAVRRFRERSGSPVSFFVRWRFPLLHELNPQSTVVESPDAIEPASSNPYRPEVSENNKSAAVAYKGSYSTFVMAFHLRLEYRRSTGTADETGHSFSSRETPRLKPLTVSE
jgi:hypothetical protein